MGTQQSQSSIPLIKTRPELSRELADDAIALLHGRYLVPTPGNDIWKQHQEVNLARCYAILTSYPNITAFSHLSAALMLGATLPRHEPDVHTVHLSRPSRTNIPLPPITFPLDGDPSLPRSTRQVYFKRHLRHQVERAIINGLPVTSPRSTLVDCLCDLPTRDALVVGDSLARLLVQPHRGQEVDALKRWDALRSSLLETDIGGKQRRGAARARRLLPLISPLSESWGESQLRFALLKAGLPMPELQYCVTTSEGTFYADLAYPSSRLLLEYDGEGKYSDRQDLLAEKVRQDALVREGWEVERIMAKDVWDEAALMHRLIGHQGRELPGKLRPRPWMGS